jgi:hypothetical protein
MQSLLFFIQNHIMRGAENLVDATDSVKQEYLHHVE